jgi:hypothetical protein
MHNPRKTERLRRVALTVYDFAGLERGGISEVHWSAANSRFVDITSTTLSSGQTLSPACVIRFVSGASSLAFPLFSEPSALTRPPEVHSRGSISHAHRPSLFTTAFSSSLFVDWLLRSRRFSVCVPRRTHQAPTPGGRTLDVSSSLRALRVSDSFPKTSLGPLPKNLQRRLGSRFAFGTLRACVNRVRGKSHKGAESHVSQRNQNHRVRRSGR